MDTFKSLKMDVGNFGGLILGAGALLFAVLNDYSPKFAPDDQETNEISPFNYLSNSLTTVGVIVTESGRDCVVLDFKSFHDNCHENTIFYHDQIKASGLEVIEASIGDCVIGVKLPNNATEEFRDSVTKIVNALAQLRSPVPCNEDASNNNNINNNNNISIDSNQSDVEVEVEVEVVAEKSESDEVNVVSGNKRALEADTDVSACGQEDEDNNEVEVNAVEHENENETDHVEGTEADDGAQPFAKKAKKD